MFPGLADARDEDCGILNKADIVRQIGCLLNLDPGIAL